MEFRKIFDTIPEQFDKYRPRYSAELFSDLIAYAKVEPGRPQNRFLILDAIIMLSSLGSIWPI